MSADWTTARVVRDRDGDLWGAPNHPALGGRWNRVGVASLKMKSAWLVDLTAYGPLTPVLDADGLPVVTTVGDLTARHLGQEVRIPFAGGDIGYRLTGLRWVGGGYVECALDPDGGMEGVTAFPLDTPCEVIE